jgi:hypothetical protein
MRGHNVRLRVRSGLIIVAIVALALGLSIGCLKRKRRLEGLALQYSARANNWEKRLIGPDGTSRSRPTSDEEVETIIRHTHWNDAVAASYLIAASQPWRLNDPDVEMIETNCSCHPGMMRPVR